MPTVDVSASVDTDRDREKERDGDRHDRADKSGSKQKSTSASTKAKDLSHVPCKFFKVGACTAGSSCPFSHASTEPGAQKEPCAWFIKGNCKFGHKCALAHILPGQNMSMDRKNKKAAQQAAAAAASASGGNEKGGKEARKKRDGQGGNSNAAPGRNNTLLGGGSTAPTRLLSPTSTAPASNRPPMPLKVSISPSAPAPPLKDTDFASFAALDEMEGVQLPAPPAHGKSQAPEAGAPADTTNDGDPQYESTPSPVPLPTSAPRVTTAMAPSEFGPIGSPPSASRGQQSATSLNNGTFTPGTSPRGPSHLNGVNLGTSPQTGHGFISSSPFSAPGSQSVFLNNSYAGHGVAASLGSGLAMMGGRRGWGDVDVSASPAKGGHSMLSSSVQRSSLLNGNVRGEYAIDLEYEEFGRGRKLDSAVDDGDMEDFIPGSLTDLLTPEERNRRMSRSGSSVRPLASALTAGAPSSNNPATQNEPAVPTASVGNRPGHRYSSSVPAPSLLGDVKSIWSDTSVGGPLPGSPSAQPTHRATPSASFASRFEGLTISGGQQGGNNDDMGMSMSMGSTGAASSLGMMSPSNASAAFLPGLHHNYLKSKASQQTQLGLGSGGVGGLSRGLRGTSGPLYPPGGGNGHTAGGNLTTTTNYMSGGLGSSTNQGFPASANAQSTLSQLPSYRAAPSPFDLTQPMYQVHNNQSSRPIPTSDSNKQPGGGGGGVGGGGGGEFGFGGTSGLGGERFGGSGLGGAHGHGHGTNGGMGNGGGGGGGGGAGGHGSGMGGLEGEIMTGQFLSPNTRALQAHAPGQSLPQGLAAGYSRIHALPPLANLASPNAGGGGVFPSSGMDNGGLGTTVGMSMNTMMNAPVRQEWGDSSLPPQPSPLVTGPSNATSNSSGNGNGRSNNATPAPLHRNGMPSNNNNFTGPSATNANATLTPGYNSGSGVLGASPGLESVLSKLSYSAAAKGSSSGGGVGSTSPTPTPPGLVKGAGRYTPVHGHGGAQGGLSSSSPLRPRPRDDDDELFVMDK